MSRAAFLSLLLHALALAVLLLSIRPRQQEEFVPPSSFAVVFEHGGAPRATAPPTVRRGPPQPAFRPARPIPPPPKPAPARPRVAEAEPAPAVRPTPPARPAPPRPAMPRAQPGFAVHLPAAGELQALLLPPPPLPRATPPPVPLPAPAHRPTARPAPLAHTILMPSMSFGSAPRAAPATPGRGLNLALSQSVIRNAFAPDFAVEGHIGPDWLAELTRWVNQRKYYPDSAIQMGQQGAVEIALVIDRTGKVESARLLQSSGSPFLDSAWLGMFQGAVVPPFPPGTKADRITIRATMHYILVD